MQTDYIITDFEILNSFRNVIKGGDIFSQKNPFIFVLLLLYILVRKVQNVFYIKHKKIGHADFSVKEYSGMFVPKNGSQFDYKFADFVFFKACKNAS